MGGIVLPTADTPGYTLFRKRVACVCLAQWLPVFERLLLVRGLINESIDILQLTGANELSGGTHQAGGVFDVKQYDPRVVAVAREMGAPASWMRNMNFADGSPGNTHIHGVLSGCPHNWPAVYQITAQRRGYDGMGKGAAGTPYAGQWGYGGTDPHPDPVTYRTWAQGIIWANQRIEIEGDMYDTTARTVLTAVNANTKYAGDQLRSIANLIVAKAAEDAGRDAALSNALTQLAAAPVGSVDIAQVLAAAKEGAKAAIAETDWHVEPDNA